MRNLFVIFAAVVLLLVALWFIGFLIGAMRETPTW